MSFNTEYGLHLGAKPLPLLFPEKILFGNDLSLKAGAKVIRFFCRKKKLGNFYKKSLSLHLSMKRNLSFLALLLVLNPFNTPSSAQKAPNDFDVIAYYHGNGADVNKFHWEQLTQVIYSFCHLNGNHLKVDNATDSLAMLQLVGLKKEFPKLKVLVSLGGWGGCESCADVFASAVGRREFALSVKKILQEYKADGIDLDWEYPAIEGYPGHAYKPSDRRNFTLLVKQLRKTLGKKAEISFAAGGFASFFDQSIEWAKVMPLVNRVNLMSYDLVNGYSTVTGHHTPLFSTPSQEASVDYGVRYLKTLGVPAQKIVIGAAFYARTWVAVEPIQNGLNQTGSFKSFVPFNQFDKLFSPENDFVFYRDPAAQAPYAYCASRKEFATFDDRKSVEMKTKFAKAKGLGGIMFWELGGDVGENGLLQAIYQALQE